MNPNTPREALFGPLTLDFGVRFEQMWIDWLDHAIAILKDRQSSD